MRQARQGKAASKPGGSTRVRRGSGIDWLVALTGAETPGGDQGLSEGVAIPLSLALWQGQRAAVWQWNGRWTANLGHGPTQDLVDSTTPGTRLSTLGGLKSDARHYAVHGGDSKYLSDATCVPIIVPAFVLVGDPWWALDPVHRSIQDAAVFLPVLCCCAPVLLGDTVLLPISRAVRDPMSLSPSRMSYV
jgi:hypothetical protein